MDDVGSSNNSAAKRAVIGVVALGVLGAAGYFGFNYYRGYASLRACDLAAASELELETHAGAGVPDGLVDPAVAIPACREAARRNPESPRAAYQLFRALTSNGYAGNAQLAHVEAERLGHVEAILRTPLEEAVSQGDTRVQPLRSGAEPALRRVVAEAVARNPRAMLLASRTLSSLSGVADQRTQQTLLDIFAPLDPERALRRGMNGEFGEEPRNSLADDSEGAFGRLLTALRHQLQYDAAALDFLPALAIGDAATAAAAAQRGYLPARMTLAELTYAAEAAEGAGDLDAYVSALEDLAGAGYRPAMLRLAMIHLGSHGGAANYAEAQQWLDRISPIIVSEEQ